MGDTFCELIVPRAQRPSDILKKSLMIAGTITAVFFGLFVHPAGLAALAAMIVVDYVFLPRLKVEYEYTYVNGSVDVAAVYSKQSRKKLDELELTEAECIAPSGSAVLNDYGDTFRVVDYSTGSEKNPPYVAVFGGSDRRKVSLQMNDTMLEDLRARMPRRVFLN